MRVKIENERKFLVRTAPLKMLVSGVEIIQGYLSYPYDVSLPRIIRVRIEDNKRGFLTVKIKTEPGRNIEIEGRIAIRSARQLLNDYSFVRIQKTRYKIGKFEIDVFHGDLEGLVLAELELESVEQMKEKISFPPGFEVLEVTGDRWFDNHDLARRLKENKSQLRATIKSAWRCKDASRSV